MLRGNSLQKVCTTPPVLIIIDRKYFNTGKIKVQQNYREIAASKGAIGVKVDGTFGLSVININVFKTFSKCIICAHNGQCH